MRTVENLTLLAPLETGADKSVIEVEWEAQPQLLSASAAAYVEERWNHYVAQAKLAGQSLFNGPITRLLGVETDRRSQITLRLGPTDYKTFLVTRMRDRAWFEAHAPEAMALALGNSALLTHGGHALLGLRSTRVSAYPQRLHMFGGVLERLGTNDFPANTQGLMSHLLLELREEASVVPNELDPRGPKVLGIAHDDFLGQPEIFWQWETTLALEAVAARLDAAEHAGWQIVRRGEMTEQLWQAMTPMARQAWQVWSQG